MTERLGSGDRQRGIARIALALILCVLLLSAAGLSTNLLDASAQPPGTSPTRTETTTGGTTSPGTPAPPQGPQIEFLNPSKYASPEWISNKQDNDALYHLVAWVSQPPPDAMVVFEIQEGSNPPRTIGTAQRVGGPNGDTFEFYWNLEDQNQAPVRDANGYVLRALLFSAAEQSPDPSASPTASETGSPLSPSPTPSPSPSPSATAAQPIDSDEETVNVDRNRETVEIIDPPNPGAIGIYDPDASGGGRDPGFTMLVRTSDGADHVRVKYSTSPPGTEAAWTECRNQQTVFFTQRYKRVGCTIDPTLSPTSITAVSAVTVEDVPQQGTAPGGVCTAPLCTPASQRTESGDAHRIAQSYRADPSGLTLTTSSTNATRNSCHEMTARVVDQFDRVIWRANVDVHATGPTDGLQFAETTDTDAFKAADQGGHHATEPAFDCRTNSGSSRQQAEHTMVGDDVKHIETLPTEGTDVAGEFTFALRSPAFGQTVVEAWADEDDDDVDDTQNAQGQNDPTVDPRDVETLQWTAPSPTSPPSPSDGSPSPSASPSASSPSSPSPTATATTASPSPSPTPTLNCEPESDSNPVRTSHTILCRVNPGTASPSPSPSGPAGVRIHAEATGANDPDGQNSPGSPDFTCVTGSGGTCTLTHGPGGTGNTNDTGTTLYRAWIDSGNDATPEADTTEGRDEFQQPGQRPEADETDVVEKTWVRAPLDCDPEQDGNPTGTAHTVTCRAAAPSGASASGVNIDVEATGANNPDGNENLTDPDFTCTTDFNGTCSFTHGPGGTGAQGVTRYRAWVDADTSNATPEADVSEGRNEATEPGAVPESDETDVVEKTWTRTPTALSMAPESDQASVGTCNAFTITVTGDNQPVQGVLVDVEQRHERANNQTSNDEPAVGFCTPRAADGPNPSAVDQTQGDLDPPDESPDNRGTAGGETLSPTDAQGRVTIGITVSPANDSDGTGNVVVTAFFETDDDADPEAGEPQDSSTKTWFTAQPRTIACQPETATNPVNTQHTVTCTVRDRFGEPVEGEAVTWTEDGPGDFTSRGSRTNANGEVVAVTSSSQGGTQTITATLDDDLQGAEPGEADECDRAAGDPSGAPAGACSDSVTKTWTPTTTSPAQFARDVSIEAQKNRIVFGKNVTLGGTVESDEGAPAACTDFVEVDILRDVVGGRDEFELFATEQTDSSGAYSHSFRADVSANYVAEVEEVAQCEAATSDAEPVLVRVKVSLKLSDTNVRRGKRVRFTVVTAPCPATARDRVLLFRAIEGEFGKVGAKRTNDRCTKGFRRRVRDDSVFQARWPKQAEEFLAGKSRPKVVRVRGR
ncbi:MAG: Ig-like domain-containing protein [Actinomycetota bacterium]